jgi:hypothetical protein
MFSVCANPACQAPINYRQGRLLRFHKDHPASEEPPNTHWVQHFWLCGVCCAVYTLEYRDGSGVIIKALTETSCKPESLQFIAAT